MTRIPCPHGFSAIRYDRWETERLCASLLQQGHVHDGLQTNYTSRVVNQGIKNTYDMFEPPEVRIKPRRPRKTRRRHLEEPRKNPHQMNRRRVRDRCKTCKKAGHNKRTCPRIQAAAQHFAATNVVADAPFVGMGKM